MVALTFAVITLRGGEAQAATVTTTTDTSTACTASNCSLRGALASANATSAPGATTTIVLSPATYTLSITGADELGLKGDLDVWKSVIIEGNGATIDAGGLFRIFDVKPGATLVLKDVDLRNGSAMAGGGIYNSGTLTLDHTRIAYCNAGAGGGVFNIGALELIVSRVSDCSAGSGGGIFNSGTLEFDNALIHHCEAGTGGGVHSQGQITVKNIGALVHNTAWVDGGGLHMTGGANTTADQQLLISGNFALVDGGGISMENSTLISHRNLTIAGNEASQDGGGAFVIGGRLEAAHGEIADNRAVRHAGGLSASAGADVQLTSTIVADNAAGFDGGGAHIVGASLSLDDVDVVPSSFSSLPNVAGRSGGGVYARTSLVEILNSTFERNEAGADAGALVAIGCDTLIRNTEFVENATDEAGGRIGRTLYSAPTCIHPFCVGSPVVGLLTMEDVYMVGDASHDHFGDCLHVADQPFTMSHSSLGLCPAHIDGAAAGGFVNTTMSVAPLTDQLANASRETPPDAAPHEVASALLVTGSYGGTPTVELDHATLRYFRDGATGDPSALNGALVLRDGAVTSSHSIIEGRCELTGGVYQSPDYSLITGVTGHCPLGSTDSVVLWPVTLPTQDFSATPTHPVATGGVAAGFVPSCSRDEDQRHWPRSLGMPCAAGAHEP